MEPSAATREGLTPTTEVDVILATHGWWPWLLLYALIIGVLGAAIIYFLRQHRAKGAPRARGRAAAASSAATGPTCSRSRIRSTQTEPSRCPDELLA